MALTDRRSLERLLDRLSYDEKDERPRLRRALEMTVELLERHFKDRISSAQALYREFERDERRLPVLIEASYTDDEAFALEWALASDVFGPVRMETRIRMPITLTRKATRKDEVGLLYIKDSF